MSDRTDWIHQYAAAMETGDAQVIAAMSTPPPRLGPPVHIRVDTRDWVSTWTIQWADGVLSTYTRARERPPPKPRKPRAQRRIWGAIVIMRKPR